MYMCESFMTCLKKKDMKSWRPLRSKTFIRLKKLLDEMHEKAREDPDIYKCIEMWIKIQEQSIELLNNRKIYGFYRCYP